MKRFAPAAILWLCPLVAAADPLVVHTATARVDRAVSAADRLRLADAVADALGAGQPDVLRATETRERVETLAPAGLACDAPECAATLLATLHARGLVMVSLARGRRREVALTLRWLDAGGVVRAEQRAQEVVAEWDDALAMARVSARALLAEIPTAAVASPAPAPTAPAAGPSAAPSVPATVAPPRTEPSATRRPVEAALGGALIVGGAAALAVGAVAFAQDGEQVGALENGREEVYTATARDTVLVAVGAAALAGGVFLLVDGLRARRSLSTVSVQAQPLAGGAWLGVGGRL